MPGNWWESDFTSVVQPRRAQRWSADANLAAYHRIAREELLRRGYRPELVDKLIPTQDIDVKGLEAKPIQPPRKQETGGGGLFGKIKGALGDITETVFRGPVDNPLDVLKPLVQLFEAEQEHIAEPLREGFVSGIVTPIVRGVAAPVEAQYHTGSFLNLKRGWEEAGPQAKAQTAEAAEAPVLKQVMQAEFSPSTYLLSSSKVVTGPIGMAARLPVLSELFPTLRSQMALKAVAGGSEEAGSLLDKVQTANQALFKARTMEDLTQDVAAHKSLTVTARSLIGKVTPDSVVNWLGQRGFRLYDDELGVLLDSHSLINAYGASYAAKAVDQMRIALAKGGFELDDAGHVLNLPGKPLIGDAAEGHIPGLILTSQQKAALEVAHEPLEFLRQLERANGVKIADIKTPSGQYWHRELTARLADISDPRSLAQPIVETVEQSVKGGVRRTLGAKQPYQIPRSVVSQAEGEAAGLKYAPFFEAQETRIEQGFKSMSDQWLSSQLKGLGVGRTPSELLVAGTKEAIAPVAQRLAKLNLIEKELTNVLMHGAPKTFKGPKGIAGAGAQLRRFASMAKGAVEGAVPGVKGAIPTEEDIALVARKALAIANLPKGADRTLEWTNLRELVREMSKPLRTSYMYLRGNLRQEMQTVRASGTQAYRVSFRGRFYPLGVGERLQPLATPAARGILENTANKFNNFFRPIMATLDASFLGIQGLIGLARNPVAYSKAAWNAVVMGHDDFMAVKEASGIADEAVRMGLEYYSRTNFGEFQIGGQIIGKLPGVKQTNLWFTRFGNVLRMQMYETGRAGSLALAGKKGLTNEEALKGLARAANLAVGYNPGKVTTLETAMVFAPRFFRAQLGMIADAVTRADIAGMEARKNLVSLIGLGTLFTIGMNKALGNDTDFNPTSSNFMRIRALGRDMSVFGPWDTLVRGIITGVAKGPEEGVKYMARSKASPLMARIYDVIKGETFQGDELDWTTPTSIIESAARLGSQMTPIALQQAFEKGVPVSPGEIGASAIQMLGTKASPLTAWEQRQINQDDAAKATFGKKWDDLEPSQQYELKQADPNLVSPSQEGAWKERTDSIKAIQDQQVAIDEAYPVGPDWRSAYKANRSSLSDVLADWARRNPEEAAKLTKDAKGDPNKQALNDYFQAFDKATDPKTGQPDPGRLNLLLDNLEQSWTPDQQAYVDRNTGYTGTPRVKEYRADMRRLEDYFDLGEKVWARAQANNPDLTKYPSLESFSLELRQTYLDKGLTPAQAHDRLGQHAGLGRLSQVISSLNLRWRQAHPDLEQLLLKWGYVQTSARRRLA